MVELARNASLLKKIRRLFSNGSWSQLYNFCFSCLAPEWTVCKHSENKRKQAIVRCLLLTVNGDVYYLNRTVIASINIETDDYFDNGTIPYQFEKLF